MAFRNGTLDSCQEVPCIPQPRMTTIDISPSQVRQIPNATGTCHQNQRMLSCAFCQRRKKKCDRRFPCQHCIKAGITCVPPSELLPRPRKQRFPEAALLAKIRRYESLLQRHGIELDQEDHEGSATLKDDGHTKSSNGTPPQTLLFAEPTECTGSSGSVVSAITRDRSHDR